MRALSRATGDDHLSNPVGAQQWHPVGDRRGRDRPPGGQVGPLWVTRDHSGPLRKYRHYLLGAAREDLYSRCALTATGSALVRPSGKISHLKILDKSRVLPTFYAILSNLEYYLLAILSNLEYYQNFERKNLWQICHDIERGPGPAPGLEGLEGQCHAAQLRGTCPPALGEPKGHPRSNCGAACLPLDASDE